MCRRIRKVWEVIRSHFTDERKLHEQFAELRSAASEVVESKRALEAEINKGGEDQFRIFAERARKAKF